MLDATWSARAQRECARALARRLGTAAWFVRVDCAEATAREWVRRRAARGEDPSDAGPERVGPSRREFEPLDEWPHETRLELATDEPAWRTELPRLLARIRGPAA